MGECKYKNFIERNLVFPVRPIMEVGDQTMTFFSRMNILVDQVEVW
jgi:hypothetical protein